MASTSIATPSETATVDNGGHSKFISRYGLVGHAFLHFFLTSLLLILPNAFLLCLPEKSMLRSLRNFFFFASSDLSRCILCADEAATTAFLPCGHRDICQECAQATFDTTQECPCCRSRISGVFRIFTRTNLVSAQHPQTLLHTSYRWIFDLHWEERITEYVSRLS